jgi:hypothetical protein
MVCPFPALFRLSSFRSVPGLKGGVWDYSLSQIDGCVVGCGIVFGAAFRVVR